MRLTRAEIILLTGFLLVITAGAVTKHFRDVHRLTLPQVKASPKPDDVRRSPAPAPKAASQPP